MVAETGRLPVDNPSTHLELTMVHEAMVLEYAGPDLALVELASAMRLSVFLGLWATLFAPWGIAADAGIGGARARHARLHRQGHRPGRGAGRGRGVPGQAAVVPGTGAAGRIVRPGAARGGRVVLLRLNPLPGTGVHMTARAHRTPDERGRLRPAAQPDQRHRAAHRGADPVAPGADHDDRLCSRCRESPSPDWSPWWPCTKPPPSSASSPSASWSCAPGCCPACCAAP